MYQIQADTRDAFCIKAIVTAFQQNIASNYYFAGESHDFWELVIITEGQVGVTAGQNVYSLKKGDAILHERMEFHRLWSEGGKEAGILIFTFRTSSMPHYQTRLYQNIDLARAKDVLSRLRRSYIGHGGRLIGVREGYEIEAQIALKHLELFLLETLPQTGKVSTSSSRSAKNYAEIVKVLENHLDKNLSVEEIAKMCGMGQVNLKQTFSRYAGIGVIQYYTRLKITAAITMLKEGLTVQEVSARLGFANQNYFSTVFKRITGKCPSSYK